MTDGLIWSVIVGLAVITYLIRWSFIGLIGDRPVPKPIAEALEFVPVTVIPALVAPAVFTGTDGEFAIVPAQILAALAALGVGMAARKLLPALLAGAVVFFVVGWATG